MNHLERKFFIHDIIAYRNGTLYVERERKKRNGKLFYDFNSEIKIAFDKFDVGGVFLNSNNIHLIQKDENLNIINSYILDNNFNITKESGESYIFENSTDEYYYIKKKTEEGLFSLKTDELILQLNLDPNFKIRRVFNNSFFIEIFNKTHIISIRNIETKSNIEIDIKPILVPPVIDIPKGLPNAFMHLYEYDDRFKLSKIYNDDKLIVAAGTFFVIIDCNTGAVIHTYNFGFHNGHSFTYDYPFVYIHDQISIHKFKIEDNNTITELYNHKLEKEENLEKNGRKITLENMFDFRVYGNRIYAIDYDRYEYLLIHDAETGKRIKYIDLTLFGILDANSVNVVHNKIYIRDLADNSVTIFEREEGE